MSRRNVTNATSTTTTTSTKQLENVTPNNELTKLYKAFEWFYKMLEEPEHSHFTKPEEALFLCLDKLSDEALEAIQKYEKQDLLAKKKHELHLLQSELETLEKELLKLD